MRKANWHPMRATRNDGAWVTPLSTASEFSFLIAHMLERWSWLEDVMCQTYAILLDRAKEEAIPSFYSKGSGGGRIRLLLDAIRKHMPEGPEKVDLIEVIDRWDQDLVPFRNDVVHGNFQFAHDLGGGFIRIRTYDRKTKSIAYREINRGHLRDHLAAVSLASGRLAMANTERVELAMTVMDRRFE